MFLKFFWLNTCSLVLFLVGAACMEEQTDPFDMNSDGDADGDSDSDSDADADADSDADADADADGDGDADSDADADADADGDTDNVCDEANFELEVERPKMLIVVDRSVSMCDDNFWAPVGSAISQVVSKLKEDINFAVMFFPSVQCKDQFDFDSIGYSCSPPQANDPQIPEVPYVEFDSPDVDVLVKSAFSSLTCCGSTPTAKTLEVAKAYLDTVTSETALYAILATDGAPNCNGSLNPSTCTCTSDDPADCAEDGNADLCLDDESTYKAAKALFDGGFPTYVIGYNVPAQWKDVMNTMAENGGTGEYFPVEDTTELESALEEISGEIASCEFDVDWDSLDGSNVSEDKDLVNFYCKENESDPIGPDNLVKYDKGCKNNTGWTWLDDDTVLFCEEACEALKKGDCSVVVATFGCETIIE